MGEHDLAADPDCSEDDFGDAMCSPSPQEMEVENVVFHPNYSNPKPFQNDIAVIKLASEVVENDYVSLVCLPYIDDDENYATNRFCIHSEMFCRDLTSDFLHEGLEESSQRAQLLGGAPLPALAEGRRWSCSTFMSTSRTLTIASISFL